MENTDGQRMLTSLPEASDDSSQNEQQGANHGDDRERQSKTTKKPGEPQPVAAAGADQEHEQEQEELA